MFRNENGSWILNDDEMNQVSIWALEAADNFGRAQLFGLRDQAKREADKIFDELYSSGYYTAYHLVIKY